MPDSMDLLEQARRAFRQAAERAEAAAMQTYVEIGLTYLRMAHEEAAIFDARDEPEPELRVMK